MQNDNNGDTTHSGANSFSYDSENHLMAMNAGAVTLVYDGDGNRVAKTVGSVTTRYLVDDVNPTGLPQVVDELVGGAVTRQYTYGLDRISENQFVSGAWTPSFYGVDGGGSVRQLTNSSGTVTDSYEYDAFGNKVNSTGTTPNNYLYRGEQYDTDLSLYYLRARYYNPVSGRFLNVDSLAGHGQRRYEYAGANPVDGSDPSGNFVLASYWPLMAPLKIRFPYPHFCTPHPGNPMEDDLPPCPISHEVTVSFWPKGADGFGHIGVGVDSPPNHEVTYGFATFKQKSMLRDFTCIPQRGRIVQNETIPSYKGKPVDYMRIPIDAEQADAMEKARQNFPSGWYDDCVWNCAAYASHVLSAGHIPNVDPYSNSPLWVWWEELVLEDGYSFTRTKNVR